MTKYSFSSTAKRPVSPALQQQSRPFDLEQQMRQFMVEKRSAGLQHQVSPLTPTYNTQKQLPIPPSPPTRKLLRLTSKSKKFMSPISRGTSTSSRTGPEIRSVPHPGRIRNHHPSASAPSLVSPGEMRHLVDSRQKRPSSFVSPETPNDIFWPGIGSPGIYPSRARPWRSPENSPLLPPPRGNCGRTIPPPIHLSSPTPRKGTPVQLRNKTSEMFESVLSMYPNAKKQPAARSNPDIVTLQNSSGIAPRRITIDSVERPPRTPPPPPTPAKSRAQRQRARPNPPVPTPIPTPVGYMAELVGSEVEVAPVELMGDVEFPAPVIIAPVPQKRRRVKASAVNSKVKQRQQQPKPGTPEGKEIYALMPLPEIPDSPLPVKPVCESSPVLEVDFEGFNDGLVEWFNNFNWSEPGDILSASTSTSHSRPASGPVFNIEARASILDPDGAVVNREPSPPLQPSPTKPITTVMLSPKPPGETALLSPVYPVSPRLASYYGARASFASSVGDAFRFDEDEGCALSDVDERYEDELDVDEMYEEQFLDEGHQEQYGGGGLELEIDMILNGGYGGGSPDDWREGIYSAESSGSSVDVEEVIADYWTEEEREGDILVGMMLGEEGEEGEEGLDWAALEGAWAEEELLDRGRPRTRYLAGRNSAIEGDVVFCLKGADSI
ncbi:hypothetical protein DFP73DRAFT_591390 [Morchella snyderi]|nr:hypothetical protein DFP73DRAFT_591390 [Morchella snyderi]